jgi:hypothetical protein
MTSLTTSSSVPFPSPVALAHSYNSRGELGMFVNPYGCSCATCVDSVGTTELPSTPPPAPLVTLAPPPPLMTRSLGLGWGAGTGAATPSFWSALARSSTDEEPTTGVALGRTVTGLGYAVAESDGAASAAGGLYNGAALPGLGPCSAEEESVLVRLSDLRFSYKERQDAIYSEAYRSHDEAAAQDAEWEELDSKITAIETLLRAFGVIIRDA